MRGAKFLNCTAKRRQKNRTVQTVRSVVSFSWGASVGLPLLRGPRCTALVAPHPPGRGACRFRFPSPLRRPVALFPLSPRCAASSGPGSMPFSLSPPLSVAPPRCVVPVVAPLRAPGRAGDHAASVRHPSSIGLLPSCCLCRVVLPPPCRAAGFIAWRPAPDRSAGPRCRAPCGRCLPRSPTR